MIATYYMSKLPVPDHIVIVRGVWFQRENMEKTCEWIRSKLSDSALPAWDRKFLTKRLDEIKKAMERK